MLPADEDVRDCALARDQCKYLLSLLTVFHLVKLVDERLGAKFKRLKHLLRLLTEWAGGLRVNRDRIISDLSFNL